MSDVRNRWPAEWENHTATWVSWPHNRDTWPGKFDVIPGRFAALVKAIAHFEPVRILAGGDDVMTDAKRHVGSLPCVEFFDIETNDAWCRDHGPMFVERINESDKEQAIIDWDYNAWGGKYPPFDKDNRVPEQIASAQKIQRFVPGVILEGGAVEGNGLGTILTTRSCLLNKNRNENASQSRMEKLLAEYLSATNVLWLDRGELAGDDTDGHIDQLARFVNPNTIVAAWCDDTNDVNYAPLRANFEQLSTMRDQDGNAFSVVKLPLPAPKFYDDHRLPASYCNFYMVNGGIIVPQFDDPNDAKAIELLQQLCPDRRVIGVPSLDLVWGLGSFHCLTQQQPSV